MKTRLDGKVALITGGGSGIGRAAALAFAREGAKVFIADVAAKGGEETVRVIENEGWEATFLRTDVSRAADVDALVKATVQTYGRLDCAFNNAGVEGEVVKTADCSEEGWDRTLAVNLKGVWLCMKYEIRQMLKQGGGSIVNCASAFGLVGVAAMADYVASKHGVVGLTKAAALDYGKEGIRINCVCPGATRTPLLERWFASAPDLEAQTTAAMPLGRLGAPEEVAEAVVWLSSDAASNVLGHALSVDSGQVVP